MDCVIMQHLRANCADGARSVRHERISIDQLSSLFFDVATWIQRDDPLLVEVVATLLCIDFYTAPVGPFGTEVLSKTRARVLSEAMFRIGRDYMHVFISTGAAERASMKRNPGERGVSPSR